MRRVTVPLGLVIAAFGALLAARPDLTADALSRPHETHLQWINLRASFGGTLIGVGLFLTWLPALAPYGRAFLGLLGWAMAGIGAARVTGFALDGPPDSRQWIWIIAEVLIAAACYVIVKRRYPTGKSVRDVG